MPIGVSDGVGSQLALNDCHCRFGQEKEHVVPHVKGWHIADGLQILSGRSSLPRSGERAES